MQARARGFYSFQSLETIPGVYPAHYSIGTGGFFLGGKALGCVKVISHLQIRDPRVFQKSRRRLQILGVRRMIRSKLSAAKSQIWREMHTSVLYETYCW